MARIQSPCRLARAEVTLGWVTTPSQPSTMHVMNPVAARPAPQKIWRASATRIWTAPTWAAVHEHRRGKSS